jgi:hypothetical protein
LPCIPLEIVEIEWWATKIIGYHRTLSDYTWLLNIIYMMPYDTVCEQLWTSTGYRSTASTMIATVMSMLVEVWNPRDARMATFQSRRLVDGAKPTLADGSVG